jgi:hypothetical protein
MNAYGTFVRLGAWGAGGWQSTLLYMVRYPADGTVRVATLRPGARHWLSRHAGAHTLPPPGRTI